MAQLRKDQNGEIGGQQSKGAPRGHFISETIVDQLMSPTQTDDGTGQIDKKQTNKKMKQINKTKKSRHNKD